MEPEKLLEVIKAGEGQTLEFKRECPKDIATDVCALANADGGTIVFGVSDGGELVGCNAKEVKEKVSAAMNSVFPAPSIRFEDAAVGQKNFVVMTVGKVKGLCAIGGTAHIRIGVAKRPMSLNEIVAQASESVLSTTLDRQPTTAGLEGLDEKAVSWFGERRAGRGLKYAGLMELLRKMGAVVKANGSERLSLAGLLFFSKDPQSYLPHTYLRISINGEWVRVGGAIWAIADQAEAILEKNIKTVSIKSGFRREDHREYPMPAVREAVINALVHRNYAVESEVFVYLDGERLRVVNPGSFPPGVSIDDPRPVPRNPLLYELMFQAGYVEKQGSGIKLILEQCQRSPLCRVSYKISGGFTEVAFERKIEKALEKELAEILERLAGESKTASALAEELGISKMTALRRLRALREMGIVERQGRGSRTEYRRP